jgi:hypothetical protein
LEKRNGGVGLLVGPSIIYIPENCVFLLLAMVVRPATSMSVCLMMSIRHFSQPNAAAFENTRFDIPGENILNVV